MHDRSEFVRMTSIDPVDAHLRKLRVNVGVVEVDLDVGVAVGSRLFVLEAPRVGEFVHDRRLVLTSATLVKR